ncbi:MAG: acyltransferase [Saccharofermentanales bacterium]
MAIIQKILTGIRELWYFAWGNIFAVFLYDKKYLKSRYFRSRHHNIGAIGWRWTVSDFMARFLLGINKGVRFPISPRVCVANPSNIEFDVDDLNNFQGSGNYYQAISNGKIFIGSGSWIAPNVGIITANHDVQDLSHHMEGRDVVIGDRCWIGMNSTILPGVHLAPGTVVGAGSVVTKSFLDGNCVIAGNPAKKIRDIETRSNFA